MLNNRDEKYQSQESEESEYHFSDDDVSYEVENESSQQTKPMAAESKASILGSATQTKRMVTSLFVFLILVYIVYKMVAPTTSVTTSDVASQPIVAEQAPSVAVNKPQQTAASTTSSSSVPLATSTSPAVAAANAEPAVVVTAPSVVATSPPPAVVSNAPTTGEVPVSSVSAPSTPVIAASPASQSGSPSTLAADTSQPQAMSAPQTPPVATMPSVIPVQTSSPTYPVAQQETTPIAASAPQQAPTDQAGVSVDNVQKPNELAAENKVLQDQLQLLNSRVANIETQMNQLMQVLSRQNQSTENTMANDNDNRMVSSQAATSTYRINYSVQAIIPGRAWLRSESGETVTVAEGDVIKDVGRVTKIDPYDGVVEINVGNKVVSLSYGTNG